MAGQNWRVRSANGSTTKNAIDGTMTRRIDHERSEISSRLCVSRYSQIIARIDVTGRETITAPRSEERRATSLATAMITPDTRALTASSTRLALEQRGDALPDADAKRREAVAAVPATELVQERHHETRTAHPERVAERDRAAVHVHALLVEPELPDDGEALRRERLVQLDEVDVRGGDAGALQQLAHGRDRPDAHHARIDAGRGR